MTPEDQTTLAKVERLLAEAKYDFGSSEVNRDTLTAMRELSEALALLRGLLAEAQVNPSEAKATENIAETLEQMYVIRQHAEPEPVGMVDLVRVVVHEARRTGLLAEGEESREP